MHAGKHPLHDQRWIATGDAVVEFGHDPRSWALESGSLICEMRDGMLGNAPLIAAAPELLAALKWCQAVYGRDWPTNSAINETIAKAEASK